jgi:hypothetical protein
MQIPSMMLDLGDGDAFDWILHKDAAQQVLDRRTQIELFRNAIVQLHNLCHYLLEVRSALPLQAEKCCSEKTRRKRRRPTFGSSEFIVDISVRLKTL